MSFFNIFRKKKEEDNISPIKNEIRSLARNEILIEYDETAANHLPDSSKIGGKPFLPEDFIWPEYTSYDDDTSRHLSFFCQINLREAKPYDKDGLLPSEGMLYFFYEAESFCWGFDPKDAGCAKVIYFENTEGFCPCDLPEDIPEEYVIPEIFVNFRSQESYPNYDEYDIHTSSVYDWDDYDEALEALGLDPDEDVDCHKILGYADIIQSEMLTECERISRGLYCGDSVSYASTPEEERLIIKDGAKEWILLLQLGTIETDDFEFMFGDCGMLYFYIRKYDLAHKNFNSTWFSLQCY